MRKSTIGRLWLGGLAGIVFIWVVTGHGFFWPGIFLGLWGAGLLIHAWDVWFRRPITEEDISREIDRQHHSPA